MEDLPRVETLMLSTFPGNYKVPRVPEVQLDTCITVCSLQVVQASPSLHLKGIFCLLQIITARLLNIRLQTPLSDRLLIISGFKSSSHLR